MDPKPGSELLVAWFIYFPIALVASIILALAVSGLARWLG